MSICEIFDIVEILELFKSLLTPTIALITVYIAYQQYRTNKVKLFIDCYDRRLEVYEEVVDMLRVINSGQFDYSDLTKFQQATTQSCFLFGKDISDYINEIYLRGVNFRYLKEELDNKDISEDDRRKIIKDLKNERIWFGTQHTPAILKFNKYLNITAN